ncbi:MAG: GntR family transcriptional regulator [Firmicutes bacterium]|nr:GntR family transcriptional regulator [Bacillota bacterium]
MKAQDSPENGGITARADALGGKVDHNTLSAEAVNRLRVAILKGRLKPGERIIQSKFAKELGMSRIPLREALRQLETEGLIKNEPYKGAVVVDFGKDDVREIYTLRAMLESLATEVATPRLTDEDLARLRQIQDRIISLVQEGDYDEASRVGGDFHMTLYMASGWKRLIEIIRQLWMRRPHVDLFLKGRSSVSLRQHEEILGALQERNAWKAAKLVRLHIESAEEALLCEMQTTEHALTDRQ